MDRLYIAMVLLAGPAMLLWPPGTTPNRFVPYEDICPPSRPTSLACVRRTREDAALWHRGYSPRGYDPWAQRPMEPTQ